MKPQTNPSPQPNVFTPCEVPGCRSIACGHRTICRVCTALITTKEVNRFKAAVGGKNKLRYFETVLVPTIQKRHQKRSLN